MNIVFVVKLFFITYNIKFTDFILTFDAVQVSFTESRHFSFLKFRMPSSK